MTEFPAGDPRQLWQRQPTEPFPMSPQQLRRKAEEREAKFRREALSSVALGLTLGVAAGAAAIAADERRVAVGWGLLSLSGMYFARQVHKWLWPGRLAHDATTEATVRFYRTLLERRRDFGANAMRRSGLPLAFLGIAIVLAPPLIRSPQLLPKAAPVLVLLAVWLAVYFPKKRRAQRSLEQEIDALREFEAGDPGE